MSDSTESKEKLIEIPKEIVERLQICMSDLHQAAVEYGRIQNLYTKEQLLGDRPPEARRNIRISFKELSECAKAYYKIDEEIKEILSKAENANPDTKST